MRKTSIEQPTRLIFPLKSITLPCKSGEQKLSQKLYHVREKNISFPRHYADAPPSNFSQISKTCKTNAVPLTFAQLPVTTLRMQISAIFIFAALLFGTLL